MISDGKHVVLIIQDKAYKYKWSSTYGFFELDGDAISVSSLFKIEVPDDFRIKAAFTHYKAESCKNRKEICAKTTLITSNQHYEATWINKVSTIPPTNFNKLKLPYRNAVGRDFRTNGTCI